MNLYRWVERRYLRTIDGFICNSETTRSTVEAVVGGLEPVVVAYPAADHRSVPVDRGAAAARAHEAGPLRLLFVGNVTPRKGCHLLLTALTSLPKESWQLKIVGDMSVDPKYVRQLKHQADAAGISAYIHWYDRLSDTDLASLLSTSQALVVPSSYEGFGIVYLEAMSHGLPAIATTSGAAHEIISNGVNGFLVPPDDHLTLANRIQTLHEDRVLLAQQSLAALDRALTHPTWNTSMARVREFLLEMVR